MRNGYAHSVLDSYISQVREIRQKRSERLNGLTSRRQALAYQKSVQAAIRRACGPRPPKTPLNSVVTGVIRRRGHRIEKVLFESRPGCLVTANLYIPNDLNGKAPTVLGSCGHSDDGKAAEPYQGFCHRLVKAGFVVLIFDPVNQGERDQYLRLKDREAVRACTRAHNMMGKQMELVDDWFGSWRLWDGIRALDYLLTRPEVDPKRVGITGNSGGGTMTTWIWAAEPRLTMAAPSCFVTTFLANLENELPADAEQYPPGVIGAGLEMADFLIARAPAPVILMGQKYCFFDRRGLAEAYGEVRRFYDLIGAPRNTVDHFLGPVGHGYSPHNQEAMVRFFAKQEGLRTPAPMRSSDRLPDADLFAAKNGQVLNNGAVPIYKMIAAEANRQVESRAPKAAAELKRSVRRVLQVTPRRAAPHYRVLRPEHASGSRIARYAVETEPQDGGTHIRTILRKSLNTPYSVTLDVEPVVHLFVPHVSAETDMAEDPAARRLQKKGPLYGVDVRGLGESIPDDESQAFFHSYGMDYMFHGYGLLLGRSYLGQRVNDLLGVIRLLESEGAGKVHVYGRGQGAILSLFAALLHGKLASVTLKNSPLSFHSWTQTPLVAWPSANFPRGVLKHFDIADCLKALGGSVKLVQPWGPGMKPLSPRRIQSEMKELGLPKRMLVKG